jgi:hypothetical protein
VFFTEVYPKIDRCPTSLTRALRRLPHQRTVGGLRIIIVVDLILRRHRIGHSFRILVIVGQAAGLRGGRNP